LSGAQARNLEKIFECKGPRSDGAHSGHLRAARAHARGQLQVELAQLEHLLPRLTRYWGTCPVSPVASACAVAEGESQLEADRRKVQERIDKLREELATVRRQRATQRSGRQRSQWPLASIVGYTNAGKFDLASIGSGRVGAGRRHFVATLDPTTRRLRLPTNQNVLLSDTVGFIRKLPHDLVESFKGHARRSCRGGPVAARGGHQPSAGGRTNRGGERGLERTRRAGQANADGFPTRSIASR